MKITTQNNFITTNAFDNVQSKDVQSSFFRKTEDNISVKVTFSDE